MPSYRAADRVELGTTGVKATRLAVGTVPLGGFPTALTEAEAQATLDAAWEHGIRYFDTAPLYGFGRAEERLGRFLARHPTEPDPAVVATKVGRLLVNDPAADAQIDADVLELAPFADPPPRTPVWDFSYEGAFLSLESSLTRLGVDAVDVVHLHDPDDHADEALRGSYRALTELRDGGRIRAIGAGMNQSAVLTRFAREARFDCFLLARRYTLLDQSALADLLPIAHERGISIIVGTVLHSGLLADPSPTSRFNYGPVPPAVLGRVQHLQEVCARYDVPLAAAALQFPLGHPSVASVLVGVRSRAEIEENVRLFEWPIPDDLWPDLVRRGLLPPEAPTPSTRGA